jgi:hypothetical protein
MNDVSVSPTDIPVNDSASAPKPPGSLTRGWNDLSEAVATAQDAYTNASDALDTAAAEMERAQEIAREIGDSETAGDLTAVIRAIGDAKDELDDVAFDVDSIVSRVDEAEDDNAVSVGDVDASTPDRVIRTFVMSVGAERVLRVLDGLMSPAKADSTND